MKLNTVNFGEIEVDEELILDFPEGLLGFQDEKRFIIINNEDEENPFQWLQSINSPELSFVIINPFLVDPNYDIVIPETSQEKLGLEDQKDIGLYSMVVIPEEVENMTANLLGPIIINTKNKIGRQIILDDNRYKTKHLILKEKLEDRSV